MFLHQNLFIEGRCIYVLVHEHMSGKVLFDGGIKSQPIDAVKAMIEFFDGEPCHKLPAKVQLSGGWMLVLSSKKNEYHVCSKTACSCPGFTYRRRCKHVQALAGQKEKVLPVLLADVYAFNTTEGEHRYWKEKEAKLQEQREKLSPSQELARNIVEAMES
jgi:hypothetical protein